MWLWNYQIDDYNTASTNDMFYVEVTTKTMLNILTIFFSNGDFEWDIFIDKLKILPISHLILSYYCVQSSSTILILTWYNCGSYNDFANVTFRYTNSQDRQITLNDIKF